MRPDSRIPVEAAWSADFERLDLSEWTSAVRDDGGTFYAASARSEGLPQGSGAGVVRFEVTKAERAAGLKHSKLYKQWALRPPDTRTHDDFGRLLARLPHSSAAGTYRAWYYLPRGYRAHRDWANIFQFKESYLDAAGDWRQDPRWWLAVARADGWNRHDRRRVRHAAGGAPVLVAANWGDGGSSARPLARVPRGRWFEIAAVLRPRRRIDWRLDGRLIGRSSPSVYPIGPGRRTTSWTFGVGHYGGMGKLWVDMASFTPRAPRR